MRSIGTPIPGPGRLETLRKLAPNPFPRFVPFLDEMTQRYGNTVAFALPWRSYVFINDPVAIKDVLVTQQHAFVKSMGTRALKYLLGEGLLTSEEPQHRKMRRIVQPAFHHERIAGYAREMERLAADFAAKICPDDRFDMHAAMTELTLRIASTTLFGSDEGASTREVSEALRLMMEAFPYSLLPFGQIRQRLPLPSTRRFNRARATLDRVIYDLIARKRRESEGADALSMLLAAGDAETGYRLTDEQVRDEVMTLFMAGHETTANLLTWTFYLLARNPDVEKRLRVAAEDGDRGFVTRVVHETLRLYPPAWLLGRESIGDMTLAGGSFVPANTTVFISPKLLHVRADLFPDPLRFDPDRWLGTPPAPFAFVPFGAGARRCIGEEFAWMEASIVLLALARRFRFEMDTAVEVPTLPSVTLRPAAPVAVRAVPVSLDAVIS
jgi:cytochrome P450